MESWQEQLLVGGGDTFLHYHLADRATNAGLQSDLRQSAIASASYAAQQFDDILVCDTTSAAIAITLPPARNGKELIVVFNAGTNAITITPNSGDTIESTASLLLTTVKSSAHLKALGTNWKLI